MTRTLLVRGMLVGAVAGILAFAVAYLVGEPPLEVGIAYEEATAPAHDHGGGAAAHSHADQAPAVSRAVQATAGLATATIVLGVALGGVYGLAYAAAQGRLGSSVRGTALAVAGFGFLALHLVPSLKYPANPPATSLDETIGVRTQWYFALVALSLLVVISAVLLGRSLAPRLGAWNATTVAAVAGIAAVTVLLLALPAFGETPADYSAAALWQFRLASTAIQVTLWATLGLLFGALTERSLRRPAG